jgi:hypothetical protein
LQLYPTCCCFAGEDGIFLTAHLCSVAESKSSRVELLIEDKRVGRSARGEARDVRDGFFLLGTVRRPWLHMLMGKEMASTLSSDRKSASFEHVANDVRTTEPWSRIWHLECQSKYVRSPISVLRFPDPTH